MKKNFKYFSIAWIVVLVLFNAVTFLIPNEVFGVTRFDKGVFWIAYALITLAFICQIITAYKFVNSDSADKMFLNISLLRTGYMCVCVSVLLGVIFMVVPILPDWIGAVICVIVSGYFATACVKATALSDIVDNKDQQIKESTSFIKNAVVESEILIATATNEEIKLQCNKVYDALRFSDCVSNESLKEIEGEISDSISKLKSAVKEENVTEVTASTDQLLLLINERNIRCKASK